MAKKLTEATIGGFMDESDDEWLQIAASVTDSGQVNITQGREMQKNTEEIDTKSDRSTILPNGQSKAEDSFFDENDDQWLLEASAHTEKETGQGDISLESKTDTSSTFGEEKEAVNLCSSISEPHISFLRKWFGHKEFKPLQWEIISNAMINKRDQCVVMATGYGKSLCYQVILL